MNEPRTPAQDGKLRSSPGPGSSLLGASAQSAMTGLYAWAVTVAPAAWGPGAPLAAKVSAAFGALFLVGGPVLDRAIPRESSPLAMPVSAPSGRLLSWVRTTTIWGVALSSGVVWMLVPSALSPARFDVVRGMLGVVGWALFAFACAGPPLGPFETHRDVRATEPIAGPRGRFARKDSLYIGGAVAFAVGIQGIGWAVPGTERAVLVRVVTLGAGIAIVARASNLALSQHGGRKGAAGRARLVRSLPTLFVLGVLLASGVAIMFR